MKYFTSIFDARHHVNLSQAKLSEKTGIDRADISKIERGRLNPSLRILNRIAAGMGMQLDIKYVLTDREEPNDGNIE